MTTLYDLLGVHSDADEETLRWAFRQALAANPSKSGAGADPLLRRICSSGILEDAKQRTIYQRLLEQERGRLLSKSKGVAVSTAIAAGLAVLVGTAAASFALLAPGAETTVIAVAPGDHATPTSDGRVAVAAAVRNGASALAAPPEDDDARLTAAVVDRSDDTAVEAAAAPVKDAKEDTATAAIKRNAGAAAQIVTSSSGADIAAVTAAPGKKEESETARAAVKRDIGAVVAAVDRNDESPTADAVKDGIPWFPTSGTSQTAAVEPAMRAGPKGPDAVGDKPKTNDVPDPATEQGAAPHDTNGGRSVFGLQPGDPKFRNDGQFYRERGVISYKRGALQQAISDLDEAVRLDRGDVQSLVLHGNVLDELGAYDRALADYDEAIRLEPGNAAVLHDRAILWHRRGDFDKALADLDRAIRGNFADARMYCDRGLIWYEKGSYDRAFADFNQAVKIDPTYTATCIRRGVLLHRNSEYNLALAAAYPAIRVDPKVFDLYRRSRRPGGRPESHSSPAATGAAAVLPEPESPGVPQGPLSNR